MELLKNDIIETDVEKLGCNGEGVARLAGEKTLFIAGALAGERVRSKVILVKDRFLVGRLEQVLAPSPQRITPPCPYFKRCGGCTLQHLSYDGQLAFKRQNVGETLKKVGGLAVEVNQVFAGPSYGYRNKLSLPVRNAGGKTAIGFFAPASHRIVEIDACLLQKPALNRLISVFKEYMACNELTAYDEITGRGEVRELVAREIDGHLTVTVVLNEDADLSSFDAMLASSFDDYALYKNINKSRTNVILGKFYRLTGGREREVTVDGLRTTVHPASFFQVNDEVRKEVYGRLIEACLTAPLIVDAYSGAGLLTAKLAAGGRRTVGIEINRDAHGSALELKKRNNIAAMEPVCGDCAAVIGRYTGQGAAFILDPPRSGCAPAVLAALAKEKGPLFYLSCNPRTLARDLALLNRPVQAVLPFDMFPQTVNVETLVVLS